ncbi:MAG: hypothetical protein NZ483_03570 [Verrucomicrobiae bacterium]|nr:hypothetical protein [Verrucomicrobiae bacterium]
MTTLKWALGLFLLAGIVVVVQLADPAPHSPLVRFRQLPDAPSTLSVPSGGAFTSLAGTSVADSVLNAPAPNWEADPFGEKLAMVRPLAGVFPPAEGALRVILEAARRGALRESLLRHYLQQAGTLAANPQSAAAADLFQDQFMPVWELARRCRQMEEFAAILRLADNPEQVKVLVRMVTASPQGAGGLAHVLQTAAQESTALAAACLDYVLQRGPDGLDTLLAATRKGAAGIRLVLEHPGLTAAQLRVASQPTSWLGQLEARYQAARLQHGPWVTMVKYAVLAVLSALVIALAIPGRYLQRLLSVPSGGANGATTPPAWVSALAVGVVLSGLTYLMAVAIRPETTWAVSTPTGAATAGASATMVARADNAFLSGVVVFVSLTIHAAVWFFVRAKLRAVEEDETAPASLRLKRLENLDVFLDLPLFTGLALTVIAFILITLDAGMSRHFAYTSTVVGIISAVSLRVRYLYPLRERLLHA